MTDDDIETRRTEAAKNAADRAAALEKIGVSTPPQLSRDELKHLTPQQIVEAKEAGQLDHILGRI